MRPLPSVRLLRSFAQSTAFFRRRKSTAPNTKILEASEFPPERVRNFTICAHIDHGKSTLADRLLEQTGTVVSSKINPQHLDSLPVERDRGITVRAAVASMLYDSHLLNLIDAPGHSDFRLEVITSLTACQGVLLLIDSTQGVQAQTLSAYQSAKDAGCVIIPVLSKIDLPTAEPAMCMEQMVSLLPDLDPESSIWISAKTGEGCDEILPAVLKRIPPPAPSPTNAPLQALVFGFSHDRHRGIVTVVSLKGGSVRKGDTIQSLYSKATFEVQEVGLLRPRQQPCAALHTGQVGYVVASIRDASLVPLGDTLCTPNADLEPHPAFAIAQPVVYSGLYPIDASQHDQISASVHKLALTDPAVSIARESSVALGAGFRLGFLGLLHMDVFLTRLNDEYNADVIMTPPSVEYMADVRRSHRVKGIVEEKVERVEVRNPSEWPSATELVQLYEPVVDGTLIFPTEYLGAMLELCEEHRGTQQEMRIIDSQRTLMRYQLPLSEIITHFYDSLKRKSSGYASFEYEPAGFSAANLVKLDFHIHHEPVDPLSTIVPAGKAASMGRVICKRLCESIPREQFEVAVQALVGGKVIARETIKAVRKVVASFNSTGGDKSRKDKLLSNQKESKKKMKQFGRVKVSQETFLSIVGRRPGK